MDAMDVTNEDVYCDKTRLNQILLNLLSNAIKFTPAGGMISVRLKQYPGTQRERQLYEIRVKNNGIGMSEDFVQKHFFLLLSGREVLQSAGLKVQDWAWPLPRISWI